MNKLTPDAFDSLARGAHMHMHAHTHTREDRIIWTLKAIGQRVGRGEEFARAIVQADGSPIQRKGRQYYCSERALLAFLNLQTS